MPYCVGDEIQRVCEKTGENWGSLKLNVGDKK